MKLRPVRTVLVAVLLLAIFVVFFTDLLPFELGSFLPRIRFQRTETIASSSVTLETVRDLYAFNTVEYVHRAVFPYDYLPDGMSIVDILGKLRTSTTTVQRTLTPEEYRYFMAHNLALDIGMDISGHRDFVVVTVVLTAGFDLEHWLPQATDEPAATAGEATEPSDGFRVETIATPDGSIRRVTLSPPAPSITDVTVEDIDAEAYPYPDVTISADAWRRVAAFVEQQVEILPEIDDLLDRAAANGRAFVRDVLLRAGYDEVVFAQTAAQDSE